MKPYLPKTRKCFHDKLFTVALTTLLKVIKLNKKILLAIPIFLFLIYLAGMVSALGPNITINNPANNTLLNSSATSVTIIIYTNESAVCKYDNISENFSYDGNANSLTPIGPGTTHVLFEWSVSSGNTYNLYYKCNSTYWYQSGISDIAAYHTFSVNATANTTNTTNTTATINGYAFLEGKTDHSGIAVQLVINGVGSAGNSAATAANGSYTLYNVTPAAAGYYFVSALKTPYSDDSAYSEDSVTLPEILDGQSYTLEDLLLNYNKNISFKWAYQPVNTSKNLTDGLETGSITLSSAINGKRGIIFSTNTLTGPVADIYFGDTKDNLMSFWANNGDGGVIDMGAVSLDSVTAAPASGYNSQNTSFVIGHTYVVKTRDGHHYAKLYTSIDITAPVISNVINATSATDNVTITWNTNENSNSTVYYGFTADYGSTAANINYVTSHSVLLTGLTAGGVLYHYKVGSCDNSSNCANSSDYNFSSVAVAAGGGGGGVGSNCSWPDVGEWLINGTDYIQCNGKDITLYNPLIMRDQAKLVLNNSTLTLKVEDYSNRRVYLYDTANLTVIGSEIIDIYGETVINLSSGSSVYIENSLIEGAGFDVSSNTTAKLKNVTFTNFKGFYSGTKSVIEIENSLFDRAEFSGNSVNKIVNSTFKDKTEFSGNSNNIISNSTFYGRRDSPYGYPPIFGGNSVNNISSSSFCGDVEFKGNSTNNVSNSKFGINCPKETETYIDEETGEEVTWEKIRMTDILFLGDSNNIIINSTFNNSYLKFREYYDLKEEPKTAVINSTFYNGLDLYIQPNENMTLKNIKQGIINGSVYSVINKFELNLTNTQIEHVYLYGEINSTTTVINSTLHWASFYGGSTNVIKDSVINESNFDSGTHNTIENSNFKASIVVYEDSDTTIKDSIITLLGITSIDDNLTINNLKPGIINHTLGSVIITNTDISNFGLLNWGNATILNSDILVLSSGSAIAIENSDIGILQTYSNTITRAYNSTFNATRYINLFEELTGERYDLHSRFLGNNTIENSSFYDKVELGGVANFTGSVIQGFYTIGPLYTECSVFIAADGTETETCALNGYPTISGTLNITNKTIDEFYGDVILTRYYPLYINALGPANNKLVSIKGNNGLIWSGNTDSEGYLEAVLMFNSSNYNDTYNIVIDNVVVDNISLTKDTPIRYTIPVIYNLVNSSITDTSATISWNTNKNIDAKLYYGLTKAYESSIINETLSATHSFSLTGLMPNMLYQYKAESCDEVNYCAVSYGTLTTSEPVDNTAPAISNVAASSITTSSATISWDTNEAATGQMEYGKTTAYGINTTMDARLLTSHSFNLTGLSYNTLYYYKIYSYDGVGNLATAESSFTTLDDATAPVISNVQVKEVYEDGAYLYAETNEESWYDLSWPESNVLIDYGKNESYGRTSIAGEISHSEGVWRYGMIYHINYFEPNKTYYYRFAAKDKAGNIAYSDNYNFTTLSVEPPINETQLCLYNGDCWIDSKCYTDGSTNPANYMQYCDSGKTQTVWSYKAPQFDSVMAWLGDSAGTQEIFYVIADVSQPVTLRGTATPMPGDTRVLFFSPINTTTNIYSTNVVVGANRNVSYKIFATNEAGLTAEFSGLVESARPNLIVRQSDKRLHNSTFKNQTVYIPDNKTVELPLNDTHSSRLLLKTDSEILKKADVVDVYFINNPSAYASLPLNNALDSFEINLTFDNTTTNLTYCMGYEGFSSIDENTIEAYKLIGSGWNKIDSTKNTVSKEICAVIKSAQTPYMFAGNTASSQSSNNGGGGDDGAAVGGGGGGGGGARIVPKPTPEPIAEEAAPAEETISLFGKGKSPYNINKAVSMITGAVTGLKGPVSTIGLIIMMAVIIVGLGAYTFNERRKYY